MILLYIAFFALKTHGYKTKSVEVITEEQRTEIICNLNKQGKAFWKCNGEWYEIEEMQIVKMERVI